MQSKYSSFFKRVGVDLLFLLGASLLFILSFPGLLFPWGIAPLAYVCLVPLFLLIRRVGIIKALIYGFFYGYITYSGFNFWLAAFNPLSFILVPFIYASYMFLLFPFLKAADVLFPRKGFYVMILLWLGYEVLRTKGFLGYSYGILGYSQYPFRSLISIADIFGVYGVSLLVALPSAFIASVIAEKKSSGLMWKVLLKKKISLIGGYAALIILAVSYGSIRKVNYQAKDLPSVRISLIQHNLNSWLNGYEVYSAALNDMIRLSGKARSEDPDLIVWSETAFVPPYEWTYKKRPADALDDLDLVLRLKEFLEGEDIPYVIGNNDSYDYYNITRDYNTALHLNRGEIVDRFHKIRLVPFSEHFPYEKAFPWLYNQIVESGAPMYEKGGTYSLFTINGVRFAPMICFEDTFGYLSRNFVRKGAQILLDISNDSWSPAPACSIQHMTTALFRAVETRRFLVRDSNAGYTCLIDPNGKIIAELKPNTQDILTVDVPVEESTETLYVRFGGWWFEATLLFGGIALLLLSFGLRIYRWIVKRHR